MFNYNELCLLFIIFILQIPQQILLDAVIMNAPSLFLILRMPLKQFGNKSNTSKCKFYYKIRCTGRRQLVNIHQIH